MKKKYFGTFIKGILSLQIFILITIAGVTLDFSWYPGQLADVDLFPFHVNINQQQAAGLVRETGYALASPEYSGIIQNAMRYYAEIVPQDIISANIPVMASIDPDEKTGISQQLNTQSSEPQTQPEVNVSENNKLFGNKQVICYCTHSSESYIPDSGKAKMEGKRGLINNVAESLVKDINRQGLKADFINTIHDYPEYNRSYTNSRQTVNNILKEVPVIALFDIHRDSIPGEGRDHGVIINGQKTAQILIIVGTDERKSHPNWHRNLKFAQELYDTAEKMYPGLIKGVMTKAGTYNQEYHDHALLLEFGSDYNSLEEARNAAGFFSRVLVQVLKEEAD
ncbi:MAG TPA: stage II sporulation protein P [Syntrophomonadaceae bacterium]|nr:stage II sporulation protein P [Syntrophomonadaceae bacterium]